MAEPKTPWLYPYREDPQQTRLGQPVFRLFVPVSLATDDASTPELEGLIDTGADAILAREETLRRRWQGLFNFSL